MIVQLSLVLLSALFNAIHSCSNDTISNGRLANYKPESSAGDSASLVCDDGYATYNPHLICGEDSSWVPTPICHKVYVRFNKTSMIKYVYPTPYDSVESSVSFSFSTPPQQSTGVLVRLTSKKLPDGSRDTLTVELVGGFLATTMQLSKQSDANGSDSKTDYYVNVLETMINELQADKDKKVEKQEEILGVLSDLASETQRQEKRLMRLQSDFQSEYSPSIGQRVIGFCHDDVLLNDDLEHRVVLQRKPSSLSMTIDNRSIECSYPSGSELDFTFTALRSIQVGHLQPSWGEDYGFTGCMTDLSVDGLSPLILADLAENADVEDQVTVQDVKFVESCGERYNAPTTQPPNKPTETPAIDPNPVTGAVEEPTKSDGSGKDKTTLIVILVTIVILILLVLLIGIVCKKYYNNKGTYKIDESRLRADPDNAEQEYFI
ncbi:hypothetical protein ACHWQZ_G006511 [Mnemiopsis leidyi]